MKNNFESSTPILKVTNLKTYFDTREGLVKAVDGVSFEIRPGEIVGLVGESGSGKSVLGFSVLGLVDHPGKVVGGSVSFKGTNLADATDAELRMIRGGRLSMIFQDPMMTLNPVLRIDTQIIETVLAHQNVSRKDARNMAIDVLRQVGISSAETRLKSYPHEFSGGMRQRIAIAIALINKPDLIIADEPTTALDVTIQAQVLAEIQKLCTMNGTALIWITHDLATIAGLADRVIVQYAGRVVEQGLVDDVLDNPRHPHTKGLLDSVPGNQGRNERLRQIPGTAPSLLNLPDGCAFMERCGNAQEVCRTLPSVTSSNFMREYRCHFPIGVSN